MLYWYEERISKSGEMEKALDPYSDQLGSAELIVQTELLIILPKKVVWTFIIYSKLVVRSYWSGGNKRQTFSLSLLKSLMSQSKMPMLILC